MRTAELRRNLWLELSAQRLIAMPLIIGILLGLTLTVAEGRGSVLRLGSWIFWLVVVLWGSRKAAGSITEEVNSGTWTGQRLSALSPSALVFGKLFGANAYVWYGGLMGLAIYAWGLPFTGWIGARRTALDLVLLLAAGVFVHAMAIAAALALLNKRRLAERLGTTLPQVLALLALLMLFGLIRLAHVLPREAWSSGFAWFWRTYSAESFLAVSAVVTVAWAVLAAVRLMAAQLQRPLIPWAWPAFTLFAMAYVQGFFSTDTSYQVLGSFGGAVAVAWLLFYLALFADRNEPLRYRHCLSAFGAGRVGQGLALLPWWVFGWAILLVVGLLSSGGSAADSAAWQELTGRLGLDLPDALDLRLSLVLFALRDAAFVLWINAGRARRADLVAAIYLLVLYGPVTVLLTKAGAGTAAQLVVPLSFGPPLLPLLSAAAQIAVLAFLTWRRWRALFSS
jgi:hypothetical protein